MWPMGVKLEGHAVQAALGVGDCVEQVDDFFGLVWTILVYTFSPGHREGWRQPSPLKTKGENGYE